MLTNNVSQILYNAFRLNIVTKHLNVFVNLLPTRHHCATPLVNYIHYGAVWVLLCPLVAEIMDKNLETDNLEMRLQALENRIYGERRSGGGKPAKVRPEY